MLCSDSQLCCVQTLSYVHSLLAIFTVCQPYVEFRLSAMLCSDSQLCAQSVSYIYSLSAICRVQTLSYVHSLLAIFTVCQPYVVFRLSAMCTVC